MTRVLVAGAAGFIGRHVVARLLEETDWDVVALARTEGSHEDVPSGERLEWVHADLAHTHPETLARVVGQVDFVVNLAASADAALSLSNPAYTVTNNVRLATTLLEFAYRQRALRRFVQVSSAEVFGTLPWSHGEEEVPRPQTPYAASKGAQDLLGIAYREAYQVPVLISHTANVFGPGQPSTKLLPVLVNRLRAWLPLEVIEGERRFIHAQDCASAWIWMLRNAPADWTHCNVAGDRRLSHVAFAQLVAAAYGRPDVGIRVQGSGRPGQQGDVLLDGARLTEAGWRHPLGVHAGVERAVAALLGEMEPA